MARYLFHSTVNFRIATGKSLGARSHQRVQLLNLLLEYYLVDGFLFGTNKFVNGFRFQQIVKSLFKLEFLHEQSCFKVCLVSLNFKNSWPRNHTIANFQ